MILSSFKRKFYFYALRTIISKITNNWYKYNIENITFKIYILKQNMSMSNANALFTVATSDW